MDVGAFTPLAIAPAARVVRTLGVRDTVDGAMICIAALAVP